MNSKSFKAIDIAKLINGTVCGNEDKTITNIAKIEEATENDISFLNNKKYFHFIDTTKAGIVIVPSEFETKRDITLIKVKDSYVSFVQMLKKLYPVKPIAKAGIHKLSSIENSAKIGENPAIAQFVSIGENVSIGKNVQIAQSVTIEDNVTIGDNVKIYSNCSIREECRIGNNVIIQNNAVIGSDGFGFSPTGGSYEKIPQVGIVILEDNVEIGANTVIDRATMGSTIVKSGTKLDNLIQVAHNVTIGENSVIAAQSGISGSSKIGKNCMIGGQVGFVGHINIGDGCMIGAQSGIKGNFKAGSVILGTPAREIKKMMKIDASLGRLPDLIYKIKDIEKQLKNLDKNDK